MSRNTHTYISSLLSSFHLVNSCSVCPSDDMDKLNISYNILKNVYNYILQNLWSRFNKVSFNQVPINYAKAFFQNLQSLSILFMLCYVNCWGPPCWNLPDIFLKKRYPIKFRRLEKWKYTLSVCSSLSTVGSYSSHWTSALCKVEDGYIAA